jgi:hypothetical protein
MRRCARAAGDAHHSAEGLHDDVVRAFVLVWPALAEAGDGGEDQTRVPLLEHFDGIAELVEHAGAEVLHQHIGPREQSVEHRAIRVQLEVERDRLLAPVHRREVGGLPVDEGQEVARFVARPGLLDLDHCRTQVGEHHRAERTGEDTREVEHDEACERAWRG